MTLGGIVMIVAGICFGGTLQFAKMLPIILVLSLIYAVSYSLWTVLLKHHSASKVAIFSFMTPIFGVIFSFILLKENSGVAALNLIVALILVCAGIIIWSIGQKDEAQ
jgi:drug/metabolite transporter (DMT)-like permease